MRGLPGHRRDQRHRGGAAADDDHPLAGIVEVLGPVLRVHDPAVERSRPANSGVSPRRSGSSRAGMKIQLALNWTGSVSVRSTSTSQRASAWTSGGEHVVEADVLIDAVLGAVSRR